VVPLEVGDTAGVVVVDVRRHHQVEAGLPSVVHGDLLRLGLTADMVATFRVGGQVRTGFADQPALRR
jgi:hypothetical protein